MSARMAMLSATLGMTIHIMNTRMPTIRTNEQKTESRYALRFLRSPGFFPANSRSRNDAGRLTRYANAMPSITGVSTDSSVFMTFLTAVKCSHNIYRSTPQATTNRYFPIDFR